MVVTHKGIKDIRINSTLLIKQGKQANLFDIIETRAELYQWLESPEAMYSSHTGFIPGQKAGLEDYYKRIVKIIETLEFQLQELWGFEKDRNHHTSWWKIKGCTCPELDNLDRIGTDQRIYNNKCMYHGGIVNEGKGRDR